jgi:hypothetical protein
LVSGIRRGVNPKYVWNLFLLKLATLESLHILEHHKLVSDHTVGDKNAKEKKFSTK